MAALRARELNSTHIPNMANIRFGSQVYTWFMQGTGKAYDNKLDHMIKDVALCLEAARDAGVPFPAAAEAQELLVAAAGRGHGDDDYVSLLEAVEGLAGRRL